MNRSYIWSLPTRIFHWSFAILITICLLTDDDLMAIHAISGYLILVPLTFRFFWGYWGPRYSKFKDFPLGIKKAKDFAKNVFTGKEIFIGHNPLASYIMLAILIIVPMIIFTGTLTLGAEESQGIFSSLGKIKIFKKTHEFLANFLYLLLFLHLLGIFVDRLLHKEHNTLNSIFNGYKNTKTDESVKINIFQKLLAIFFLFTFFIFASYLIFNTTNKLIY